MYSHNHYKITSAPILFYSRNPETSGYLFYHLPYLIVRYEIQINFFMNRGLMLSYLNIII